MSINFHKQIFIVTIAFLIIIVAVVASSCVPKWHPTDVDTNSPISNAPNTNQLAECHEQSYKFTDRDSREVNFQTYEEWSGLGNLPIPLAEPCENKRKIADLFPDETLATCIAKVFRRTEEDEISQYLLDLIADIELNAYDCQGVNNISGLEHLRSLRIVDFSQNNITDISPLSSIPFLTRLTFIGTPVADFSPLLNMKHLVELFLSKSVELPQNILSYFQENAVDIRYF
jgi:Leucine-rich repeat (LRR) protein